MDVDAWFAECDRPGDTEQLRGVSSRLMESLSHELDMELVVFREHVVAGHSIASTFATVAPLAGIQQVRFEGVLSVTLPNSKPAYADAFVFTFVGGVRLGAWDAPGGSYCLLQYVKTNAGGAGRWVNRGWQYDDYGEWAHFDRPRVELYDRLETTVDLGA